MAGNKEPGYRGKIEISTDGLETWSEIGGITSAEFPFEGETEDVTTWQDDGFRNEETTIVGVSLSIEGFIEDGDVGQQKLQSRFYASETVRALSHFRFYPDKRVNTTYWEFAGNIASYSTSHPVAEKRTYSAEINTKGQPKPVGIFTEV